MSEDEAFSFTSIKMYLICFSHFIGLFGCLKMRSSVLLALRCILFALVICLDSVGQDLDVFVIA